MFTVSRLLSSGRKARKIDLSHVAKRTKISAYYLRAIEEGRFHSVPRGFDIGYLRIYAEFLGLDPELIVKRFREETGTQGKPGDAVPPSRGDDES